MAKYSIEVDFDLLKQIADGLTEIGFRYVSEDTTDLDTGIRKLYCEANGLFFTVRLNTVKSGDAIVHLDKVSLTRPV